MRDCITSMAEMDKIKEKIGWLKVIFSLLTAINITLLGWFAQNYKILDVTIFYIALVVVIMCTVGIIIANRSAYKMINKLGDL